MANMAQWRVKLSRSFGGEERVQRLLEADNRWMSESKEENKLEMRLFHLRGTGESWKCSTHTTVPIYNPVESPTLP